MRLLAIDPGPVKSGWIVLDGQKPEQWGWEDNHGVQIMSDQLLERDINTLVIEDVTNMGMAVGKDVFETVRWSGRFDYDCTATFIDRRVVKLTLCGNAQAKDPNIRQALIDRYGGDSVAIGGKKCRDCAGKGWRGRGRPVCASCDGKGYETPPGPLHGVSGHVWSALAVGITYLEQGVS